MSEEPQSPQPPLRNWFGFIFIATMVWGLILFSYHTAAINIMAWFAEAEEGMYLPQLHNLAKLYVHAVFFLIGPLLWSVMAGTMTHYRLQTGKNPDRETTTAIMAASIELCGIVMAAVVLGFVGTGFSFRIEMMLLLFVLSGVAVSYAFGLLRTIPKLWNEIEAKGKAEGSAQ